MMMIALSAFVSENISLFLVEHYLPSEDVGLFSVALKVSVLVSIVLIVVNTIAAPKFAEMYWGEGGGRDQLQRLLQQSTAIIFMSCFLISLVLVYFAEDILMIFGEEFVGAKTILQLLVFGQMVNAYTGPVNIFLNMTGHQNVVSLIVLISLVVSVIGNCILVPWLGINGAAITFIACMLVTNVTAVIYSQVKLGYITYFSPFLLRRL